jgi:hypothetical protein
MTSIPDGEETVEVAHLEELVWGLARQEHEFPNQLTSYRLRTKSLSLAFSRYGLRNYCPICIKWQCCIEGFLVRRLLY